MSCALPRYQVSVPYDQRYDRLLYQKHVTPVLKCMLRNIFIHVSSQYKNQNCVMGLNEMSCALPR